MIRIAKPNGTARHIPTQHLAEVVLELHGVLTYDVPPEWRWADET